MPRSRSSGALSIESNARNATFGLFFDSTLVIAAVEVVLPWSMWPIVPIFTCGLFRSNFSFAISLSAPQVKLFSVLNSWPCLPLGFFAARAANNLFRNVSRNLLVVRKVHRETATSLRAAANFRGVTEHRRQRHAHVNNLGPAARFASLHLSAARIQVRDHRSHVIFRHHHLYAHNRFE